MTYKNLKILLIIEQCNPEWSSVPLVGYNFYKEIRNLTNTTLVTHERNKNALERIHSSADIVYIYESDLTKKYYKFASRMSKFGNKTAWPLYQTLTYPIYAAFNNLVYQKFKPDVEKSQYDIVHVITPMMPRYPVKLIKACNKADVPFIIGPVNGGVPFPKGFKEVAYQEFAYFNFFRLIGRKTIPGYRETYEKATQILAGSTYTLNLVKDLFHISDDQIQLFYENGINKDFLKEPGSQRNWTNLEKDLLPLELLFVGRLVPYKGADLLLDALSRLDTSVKRNLRLTVVGDGSERTALEQQVRALQLKEIVQFTDWVTHAETKEYYSNADLFCFPSVREFGGAVVLEAMANALPCLVVDHGGIGEYVTSDTGFKVEPISREYVIQKLTKYITLLFKNDDLRKSMSINSQKRAQEFEWSEKAKKIVNIYQEVMASKEEAKKQ